LSPESESMRSMHTPGGGGTSICERGIAEGAGVRCTYPLLHIVSCSNLLLSNHLLDIA
jgi:hypothetical protein